MIDTLTAGEIWKRMWKRKSEAFDPLADVPTTDEEASIALQHCGGDIVVAGLQGLYRAFRGKGETVQVAYQMALEARVAAFEKAGN